MCICQGFGTERRCYCNTCNLPSSLRNLSLRPHCGWSMRMCYFNWPPVPIPLSRQPCVRAARTLRAPVCCVKVRFSSFPLFLVSLHLLFSSSSSSSSSAYSSLFLCLVLRADTGCVSVHVCCCAVLCRFSLSWCRGELGVHVDGHGDPTVGSRELLPRTLCRMMHMAKTIMYSCSASLKKKAQNLERLRRTPRPLGAT